VRLRSKLSARVDEAVAWRVARQFEEVHGQLGELRDQLRRIEDRLADLGGRDGELDKRLGELERRLDPVQRESSWSANELARLAPQAAAFEERLEKLQRPVVLTGELADLPEARLLVEAVREEHARVRARLALVSAYEERLRRLELRTLEPPVA
jgi:chromosome segregation ATPase